MWGGGFCMFEVELPSPKSQSQSVTTPRDASVNVTVSAPALEVIYTYVGPSATSTASTLIWGNDSSGATVDVASYPTNQDAQAALGITATVGSAPNRLTLNSTSTGAVGSWLLGGGFDDDSGAGKARDDPVPAREVARLRGDGHRDFRQAEALLADFLAENRVFRRVDHIDAARHDRDGAGFQRGEMGRRVDPPCEAGDDDVSGFAQLMRQLLRHPGSKRGGVARADDRDHRLLQERGIADAPENRGRIGDLRQMFGVGVRADGDGQGTDCAGVFPFRFGEMEGKNLIVFNACGGCDLRQCGQRFGGRSMFDHQSEEGGHTNAA